MISEEINKLLHTSNEIRTMDYQREYVLVDIRKKKDKRINHEGLVFEVNPKE